MRKLALRAFDGFGSLMGNTFCDACLTVLWSLILVVMVALAVLP